MAKKISNKQTSGPKEKFSLKSKRVQFFVAIGIVSLLGGGWFTYKSFAASTLTAVPNTTDNKSNPAAKMVIAGGGASYAADPSKNNQTIVRLTKKGDLTQATFRIMRNTKSRACFYARSNNLTLAALHARYFGSNTVGQGSLTKPNLYVTTNYSRQCLP